MRLNMGNMRCVRVPNVGFTVGAFAALVLVGCGGTDAATDKAKSGQMLGLEVHKDHEVERYDLDGDGKADVWKFYNLVGAKAPGKPRVRQLASREMDMNSDGKVDIRQHFNAEREMVREVMDLDFDGTFDATDYYQTGVLVKREQNLNFKGNVSIWKYYEGGRKVRVERDADGNARPDRFEYYEKGRLVRIGYDRDGDGKPDDYDEVVTGSGSVEAPKALKPPPKDPEDEEDEAPKDPGSA